MRPSLPLSPQHQANPPLAMSQTCMVPALIERYLMTITRVVVPTFPSLVAVTVTVPRSMPLSTPLMLSIVATLALDTVHRTARLVSTLPEASRNVACIVAGFHASTVSGAGATDTVATGTTGTSCFTVMVADAVFPSLAAVIVADPAATPVTMPLPSTVATALLDDVHETARPDSTLPLASRGVAVSFAVRPSMTSPDGGESSMELTLAAGGGVVVPGPAGESEPHAARVSVKAKLAASAAIRARCMSRCLQARR